MSTQDAVGVGHRSAPDRGKVGSLAKSCEPARYIPWSRRKEPNLAACVGRGTPPAPNDMFGPPFSPSDALGVDQPLGHEEKPLAFVRKVELARAEYSDRNAATQSLQCRDEVGELPVRVPRHVLAEETTSPAAVEGVDDAISEPSLVGITEAASGDAVRLAGVARHDAIHCATPCSWIEGGKVRPDRRRMEPPVFHARDQDAGSRGFPLHVADAASLWLGKSHAEVEPSDAGAEGEDTPGMKSHVTTPPFDANRGATFDIRGILTFFAAPRGSNRGQKREHVRTGVVFVAFPLDC